MGNQINKVSQGKGIFIWMQYVAIWITRSGHFEENVLQVRKSFFAELGIYENETFIRQVYTDFILGKANHSNENFEVSFIMKLILLCVWAELAVLGSAKSAFKFKYEILNRVKTYPIQCMWQDISLKSEINNP